MLYQLKNFSYTLIEHARNINMQIYLKMKNLPSLKLENLMTITSDSVSLFASVALWGRQGLKDTVENYGHQIIQFPRW